VLGEVAACRCFATRRERESPSSDAALARRLDPEVLLRVVGGREKLPCLALVWQGSSSSAAPMQHGPSSRGAVGRGRCVSDPPVMRL